MNIQNNIKSPCMGCTTRFLMCHDHCESYTTYQEACSSIREGRRNFNNTRGIAVESAFRQQKYRSH